MVPLPWPSTKKNKNALQVIGSKYKINKIDENILNAKMETQILLLTATKKQADEFQAEIDNDIADAEDGLCGLKYESNMRIKVSKSQYESSYDTPSRIGLAVGGAKDTNNFRKCIEQNIMPSLNSITYNGLLYEYYFDTTINTTDHKYHSDDGSVLFYPSYCSAKTMNAYDSNNEYEYYLSVGFNSNIKQSEFKRKHLNLVIVLDISASMTCPLITLKDDDEKQRMRSNNDEWRNKLKIGDELDVKYGKGWYRGQIIEMNENNVMIKYVGCTKKYDKMFKIKSERLQPLNSQNTKFLQAKNAINLLLKHLTPSDRIGLITFGKKAKIEQKLQFINDLNMDQLKSNLFSNVYCFGGTNFEKGYLSAIKLYDDLFNDDEYLLNTCINDTNQYSNRIIILTDAQPNAGKKDPHSLLSMISKYAENKSNHIYTTIVGIGLDFNADLIETISSTRDFQQKIDKQEFEYMVTPLVFNVCLRLICEGNVFQIEKVYGCSNDKQTNNIIENGEIMKLNTLFASKKSNKKIDKGQIKGGIQLIKLKKHGIINENENNKNNINISLEVSFEDRNGKKYKNYKRLLMIEVSMN